MKHLTGADNPTLRRVADLMDSAADRRAAGLAVVEGGHLLESCVTACGVASVESLLLREDLPPTAAARALSLASGAAVATVSARAFARLSPVAGDNGLLAVVRIPADPAPEFAGGLELWLDEIQDPGNAGAIVRTAAAAGASTVVFGPGSADPWAPKCLRGGMGGHFQCRVVQGEGLAARARRYRGRLVSTAGAGATDLYAADLAGDVAILLGAEGRGLAPELRALAALEVSIPMAGGVESLNVAAAAAVVCFERVRQLRHGGVKREI